MDTHPQKIFKDMVVATPCNRLGATVHNITTKVDPYT